MIDHQFGNSFPCKVRCIYLNTFVYDLVDKIEYRFKLINM